MPKRSIYLQSPDNLYRRTRRDLEFLCNYWNRLLATNQNYDICLPDLLRANHLMRHLSSNHGLQVNVSFTILDDTDRLEPQDIYTELYQLNNVSPFCTQSRNGFRRSPCNTNTARYNNLLRNYIRQMNENYSAIERELIRASILTPLVERDRFTGFENTFYNQRAGTYNWNKFPVGGQTCSARNSSGLREKYVNLQENNNRAACASFQHECCNPNKNASYLVNQQPAKQKENLFKGFNDLPKTAEQFSFQNSSQFAPSCSTVKNLQANNNVLQNCVGTALDRNDSAMIKRRNSKQLMKKCQSVDKIVNDAMKTSHSMESPNVKSNNDDVATNKSNKESINLQLNSCRENALPESSITTDQNRQERGNKRKLDDLEDRSTTAEFDLRISSQGNQWRMPEEIKPRVKDASKIFTLEKTAKNRIRNGKMTMEGKSFSRKNISSPKYANFLRMFCKEEVDELRNSSSRRDNGEKLQRRRGLSTENTGYDEANSRIERKTPTPRSTVHTTYNPIIHSSATDSILDSSGLTIQLLRLAVLLYAPALMPTLNSLIAQQNQQTSVSSSFERSNDLLTQIFRLLNEQQSISNLPFVSLESERVSSTLVAETNTENSQIHSEQKEKNISITTRKSAFSLKEESISAGTSRSNSNNHVQQQNKKDRRLTSMLTSSDVRLDRNIFTIEDFQKFKEFLKIGKKRSEDVRSLSTRNKNEIVMREYFRNWFHQLLQQLNSASSNLSITDQKAKYSERSLENTGENSSLKEIKKQENMDRLIVEESDFLKDKNIFTEYEKEDSDDQKSFTSATSTNSSKSLQLEQSDARKEQSDAESQNKNLQN